MELRLQKARNLLMQTDMSVINVALACGFASPSHFSKCYRSHYNTTPYRERGTQGIPRRRTGGAAVDLGSATGEFQRPASGSAPKRLSPVVPFWQAQTR